MLFKEFATTLETTTPWSCPSSRPASHCPARGLEVSNGHCALQWPGLLHAKQEPGLIWLLNYPSNVGIGLTAELESVTELVGIGRLLGKSRLTGANLDLDFRAFCMACDLALASALIIFFSSSESSARSFFLYSWMIIHPNSDLSANRMCFCLSRQANSHLYLVILWPCQAAETSTMTWPRLTHRSASN